jgi:hypothetical protein
MASKKLVLTALVAGLLVFAVSFGVKSSSANSPENNDVKKEVTFSKDVAPIFFKNCAECHRPNDIAPMSLLTYKDARPWARSIKEMVTTRQMPPWSADSHYGEFANNAQLSQGDVDTIAAWVDQGAKEGDAKDLPPQPGFVNGWRTGTPDVILSMEKPYDIPAGGPDQYIFFTIPTNFKQDVWIRAAEIKPGNKKVVHHVIAFVLTPEQAAMMKGRLGENRGAAGSSIFYQDGTLQRVKMDAAVEDDGCGSPNGGSAFGSNSRDNGFSGSLLAGYAPGLEEDNYGEGYAKRIPAGSVVVFQMHYSNFKGGLNKPETDQTSIGLTFSKTPPSQLSKMAVTRAVSNMFFKIPAGDPNHEVTSCMTFDQDAQIVSYMPHMHLRGKDMRYELTYPDGRKETLLSVPKFNFNWQTEYKLKAPIAVPKGSHLAVTAHFDNSERNKYNPDPAKVVRWGDPTYDEMMIGWITYLVDRPKERTVATIDPRILDRYTGQYQFAPNYALTITKEGDKLMGQAPGQPKVQFFPESETKFFLKVIDADLTFVKNEKGEVTEAIFNMNGRAMHAKKVEPSAAASK